MRRTSAFWIGVLLAAGGMLISCKVMPEEPGGVASANAPPRDDGAQAARESTVQVNWLERIEIVRGNASRGPWRMNRSEWDFVDDGTVAINHAGLVAVAWADHKKQDVLFQMFSPAPESEPLLDEPVNVSRSGTIFSWLPRVIITDADSRDEVEVFIVWQEIVFSGGSHGGEIFFARSGDGGRSFSRPVNLSNTTAGAGKGRLTSSHWHNGSYDFARAIDGAIYVAWTEYEGNLWLAGSTDNGESFSSPLHIFGDERTRIARGPSLAIGNDNTIHLAWTVGEDRGANIHYAISTDEGRSFGQPRIVHESDDHADAPKLAVDSRGVLHVVWAESEAGPFQRYRVLYSRLKDAEGSFGTPREIATEHSGGRRFESVHFPMLRLDGQDNLYVTYELYANVRGRPHGLGFTYSTNGGERFATPQIIPGSDDRALGFNGSQQGLLMNKLAVNTRGQIAIVNPTYRDGDASRVHLYRAELDQ